ncbi:MAG: hypothetical protein Ta2B_25390 [Termitinemataceae bacterium]|nr:MAG: hypothetical protein Ta2B_25390 [Termitinemataceae bacterium]
MLDCRKRLVNPFVRVAVVVITAISLALAFSCTAPEDDLDGGGGSSRPSGLYTVIFDPTGGSFDGSNEALEVKTDSNSRAKVPAEPTKEGFSFSGWHLEDNINSPDFTNATVVSTDMTVYAVWSGEAIKVTFKVRDAEGEYVEHSSAFLTHPKDTVDSLTEPVYDEGGSEEGGFVFQGWYTAEQENILITDMDLVNSGDPAGFSREVPATGKFELGKTKVTQKIDVYGLWQERPENSIMVSFEPYPGNVVQNSFALSFYDYRLPHTVTFPTVTRPYYTASEGGKWFMADDSTEFTKNSAEGATDGTQLTKTGSGSEDDITVHQKWSFDGYTITFNSHFGADPDNITVTTDGAAIGALPTPDARNGYSFKGWFSQENGGGTPITATTVPNCDITAHASWERVTVIFDSALGGLSGTEASPQSLDVSESTGTLDALPTKPKKTGYLFDGWWTGNAEYTVGTNVQISVTVLAKWVEVPTADNWVYDTATGGMSRDFSYSGSVQEWQVLKRGNYKFELWGAEGGKVNSARSGKGGYISGVKTLAANDTFYLFIGGKGQDCSYFNGNGVEKPGRTGGWNGGGASGGTLYGWSDGASGGGATDVRTSKNDSATDAAIPSTDNRIIVAGGGGAAGVSTQATGGNGGVGIAAGGNGGAGYEAVATQSGGSGGGISSGGSKVGVNGTKNQDGGGGGGGGYRGGGGGTGCGYCYTETRPANFGASAGGGGSSWATGFSGLNTSQTGGGSNTGNGKIKITFVP